MAKVNAAGSGLGYVTYLGATNYVVAPLANPANTVNSLAVDAAGNAYVVGRTNDPAFPATDSTFQSALASGAASASGGPPADAFVARLSPTGAQAVWATYVGGSGEDSAQSIALDASGNAWVVGTTASADFPGASGSGTDFLIEVNAFGSALSYSARYPSGTVSQSVDIDAAGRVHAAGPGGVVIALTPKAAQSTGIFGIGNAFGRTLDNRVAPGEVIAIYGTQIGPSTPVTADAAGGIFAKTLAGVVVSINDLPAPLLYVSATQINAVSPFGLLEKTSAHVRIARDGASIADFQVTVTATDPAILSNADNSAMVLNQDGSFNSQDHPAGYGSVPAIWATGTGAVPLADGQVVTAAFDDRCCQVAVDDQPATVLYAGRAPGIVAGVSQINFRVPTLPRQGTNAVAITIAVGGQTSTAGVIWVMP